jgi:hypothetical protein
MLRSKGLCVVANGMISRSGQTRAGAKVLKKCGKRFFNGRFLY